MKGKILLILSVALIFFKFNLIPKNLAFDEVEFAKLALSLGKQAYTPFSPLATGHSTLYFYIIFLSFKIFGVTNFALRLPAAVFGVLSIPVFYLILKKTFRKNDWLAFGLSLIFLTSHWYFNFTRFSFEATFLLFLELASIYFLFSKKNTHLVLSGIFAGLAFNSYTPGRIFFILPLMFIIINNFPTSPDSVGIRGASNSVIKQLLFFIIPFVILILPLSVYLLTHTDERFYNQLYLKDIRTSPVEKVLILGENLKSNFLMFDLSGDMNGRHNYPGKPALNPFIGLLFMAGLLLALKNLKQSENRFFLTYFIISLIPTLLTYPWENPNMLRTLTVLPAVVYFVGLTISSIIKINSYKKVIIVGLIFLISLSCIYELRTYFVYQAPVFKKSFEVKASLPAALTTPMDK